MVLLAGVYFKPNLIVFQTTYFALARRVEDGRNARSGKWGSCEMKTDGVMEGYDGDIQNRYDVRYNMMHALGRSAQISPELVEVLWCRTSIKLSTTVLLS